MIGSSLRPPLQVRARGAGSAASQNYRGFEQCDPSTWAKRYPGVTHRNMRAHHALAQYRQNVTLSRYHGIESAWRLRVGLLSRAKMEIRAFRSSKSPGLERRFLNQASRTPFDCQAISISPLANIIDRSVRASPNRPTVTPPWAIPGWQMFRRVAAPPKRSWPACWRTPRRRHWGGRDRAILWPIDQGPYPFGDMGQRRPAPWISSFRRYLFPRLLMPRSFGLPPVVN